jgi:hypothetical protein
MDFTETHCEGVHWIHLAEDKFQRLAFEKTVINLQFSQNAGKFSEKLRDYNLC